jgi:hypothetical protein
MAKSAKDGKEISEEIYFELKSIDSAIHCLYLSEKHSFKPFFIFGSFFTINLIILEKQCEEWSVYTHVIGSDLCTKVKTSRKICPVPSCQTFF